MKFLAIELEKAGTQPQDFKPYLLAEATKVWSLYMSGIIRELYFREDQHTAILILECVDTHQAQAALQSLPLVHTGLITFDLIPLAPYNGFSRLFSTSVEEEYNP